MKISISKAGLTNDLRSLVRSKDEADWSFAAIIYAWTTNDEFQIDRHAVSVFAEMKIPGFSVAAKIHAYREAYAVAISEGIVGAVLKGDEIVVPTASFSEYLEDTQWKIKERARSKSRAKSTQQEKLSDQSPVKEKIEVRVATPKANLERAVREVDAAIKKMDSATGVQKQQIEFARAQLVAALSTFEKASV